MPQKGNSINGNKMKFTNMQARWLDLMAIFHEIKKRILPESFLCKYNGIEIYLHILGPWIFVGTYKRGLSLTLKNMQRHAVSVLSDSIFSLAQH